MDNTHDHRESLTRREEDVLKLIAAGFSTKQIARSLGITFKTAACHRGRIIAKLNIHGVANLTRYAIRNGYVDAGENRPDRKRQQDIFEEVRIAEARYRQAMEQYGMFIKERDTFGPPNPDGSAGARRLHRAEEMAHQEYHRALIALKNYLVRD
jgi:DNA-binding CsgD family transcriptional regulator